MDSDSKPVQELISLISQLVSYDESVCDLNAYVDWKTKSILLIIQIISLVNLMDLDSQPKPQSELMSLVTQTISCLNSMDLETQPEPLSKFISLVKRAISLFKSLPVSSEEQQVSKLSSFLGKEQCFFDSVNRRWKVRSLIDEIMILEPEPKLMSLIHQIFSLVISMNSEWKKLISLSVQVIVGFKQGKIIVNEGLSRRRSKWGCLPANWKKFRLTGGADDTHFLCQGCNGQNHEEYEKAPVETKNRLHPKHSLQLAWLEGESERRKCYCCDEDLLQVFSYCSSCDFAMNMVCVEKPLVLSIDHSKWHEHPLQLFSSQASLTCDVCALVHSSSRFYICPPCGFIVHQSCISLPRVIRISRHPHRISFTPSFGKGELVCGVCRRMINNDYGGYFCIKEGCSYAGHTKCATQENVWDGKDLEGEPEEAEEELLEPFVQISDGIIQHFSHEDHYLKLDENTARDYDEDKLCQACVTPIYSGNFYSCMHCGFILHKTCAKLPRKIYHPIHPHLLTLVGGYNGVLDLDFWNRCSACPWMCNTGFFYECDKQECHFKLHLQCATVSEPLVHESHIHPLFLTSKPRERRTCRVCNGSTSSPTNETFNCLECDFALCFSCATLPHNVRYKHDKHMLTLSYGEEASTMVYWCEVCETRVNPKERFYMCDENCCVTLHIKCLLGKDFYLNPVSSYYLGKDKICILPNNHHMSRPKCCTCRKRCASKLNIKYDGSIFCSVACTCRFMM